MSSALRPGQRVKLTGVVESIPGPLDEGCARVIIDGDGEMRGRRSFPYSALTPIVEPMPDFKPGEVVRYDGENYMLRDDEVWIPCNCDLDWLSLETMSERWAESRVEVVYKAGSDE